MTWGPPHGQPYGPPSGPQKCAQCGAMIDPLALACPYCKFTTPQGVAAHQHHQAQQQQQAQWAAHASYVHTSVANARMKSTGTQSLVFGILGIILFCTPLGIVGIVQGFRARGMSKAANAPVPGTATAGLILSFISLFTSIGFITWASYDADEKRAVNEKKASAIEARLGTKPNAIVLDRDTACGLAEAHLLRDGDGHMQGYSVTTVQCMGKLSFEDDKGELDLVRVKGTTSSENYDSHVCFRRGGKWFVERVQSTSCF